MKVLISGAGIAGPTLAYWLLRYGFDPTLLERAPALRTGGYVIDFWGAGFDVAERMGLVPDLRRLGYAVDEVRIVGRDGRKISGFPVSPLDRLTHHRYVSLPRGDLAAAIYGKIEGRVETVFGNGVSAIEEHDGGVRVSFERGESRDFDLVIGADGLHSGVRGLVFGPQERFEKYLGYKAAAFETSGYRPRDENAYVTYTRVGRQIARFSLRGDRTMFLFIFTDADADIAGAGIQAQKAVLRARFENDGWECREILAFLDKSPEIYFDRVSQIRMTEWSRGRAALVGDAAFCPSFLAGQGSALAMIAAYVLAGELARAEGDYQQAFSRYHDLLSSFMAGKQEAAIGFAGAFAPKSAFRLFLRDQIAKVLSLPFAARLVFGRGLLDAISLPEYPES